MKINITIDLLKNRLNTKSVIIFLICDKHNKIIFKWSILT